MGGGALDEHDKKDKENGINKYLKGVGAEEIDTGDAILLIIPKMREQDSVEA